MRSSFFQAREQSHCLAGRNEGFTLIELMIVIVLVSVIATVAVPNFMTFIENNRVTSGANSFVGTLNYARSQAVREGRTVRVQPREEDDWQQGLEVVMGNETIRVSEPLGGNLQVTGESITFAGNGMARGIDRDDPVEFLIYTEEGGNDRRICINRGGQVRTTTDEDCER